MDADPIEIAKSEYRDAFNRGDIEGILALYSGHFTEMYEGEPSYFGVDSPKAVRRRLQELFRKYEVTLAVAIINSLVTDQLAISVGWHRFTLKDRSTGKVRRQRDRYVERWLKQPDGKWKIAFVMTCREHPPQLLPEEQAALTAARR